VELLQRRNVNARLLLLPAFCAVKTKDVVGVGEIMKGVAVHPFGIFFGLVCFCLSDPALDDYIG
jgi:hypothetical protein